MKVLPVIYNSDGCLVVDAPVPSSAIQTNLTPDGCVVYEYGDDITIENTVSALNAYKALGN